MTSVPGAPGETRVITYQATGVKKGVWSNCGILCSPNVFQGDNIACFIGQVTGR